MIRSKSESSTESLGRSPRLVLMALTYAADRVLVPAGSASLR